MDEKAPKEQDFDTIVDVLRQEGAETACVFNCQMGKGRTTTGMILACLIKDVLYGEKKKYEEQAKPNPKDYDDEEDFLAEVAFFIRSNLHFYTFSVFTNTARPTGSVWGTRQHL